MELASIERGQKDINSSLHVYRHGTVLQTNSSIEEKVSQGAFEPLI